eukprot:4397872-Pleurochrysis_carterae.AAC.1
MAVIVRPSRIHNFRPVTLRAQPRTRTSVELCALLSQRKEQHARAPTCVPMRPRACVRLCAHDHA